MTYYIIICNKFDFKYTRLIHFILKKEKLSVDFPTDTNYFFLIGTYDTGEFSSTYYRNLNRKRIMDDSLQMSVFLVFVQKFLRNVFVDPNMCW